MNNNAKNTSGDYGRSDSHGGRDSLSACLTLTANFVTDRLFDYMLQSHVSSWGFPSTL